MSSGISDTWLQITTLIGLMIMIHRITKHFNGLLGFAIKAERQKETRRNYIKVWIDDLVSNTKAQEIIFF